MTNTERYASKSANPGYFVPRPPPDCFNRDRTSPRTHTELVVARAPRLVEASRNLSQSVRSPATDFVGTTSVKPMVKTMFEVPGPGAFNLRKGDDLRRKKGIGARSFGRDRKRTGERWSSTPASVGPGSYGIPERPDSVHSPCPKFRSKLTGESREVSQLGPGSFKVSPRAEAMTRLRYSSVGFFGTSPRFASRAERLRLIESAKDHRMLNSNKDFLSENRSAAAVLTAKAREQDYLAKGKTRDQRIRTVKARRAKILHDEEVRTQQIMKRPDKLRHRRRQRSFMALIAHGVRLKDMARRLQAAREVREMLQHRAAVQMYIGKWWRKWRRQVMTHRIFRFQAVWRCSGRVATKLYRQRERRLQADTLLRHLRSVIGPRKALACVRGFAAKAALIQRMVRGRIAMREARARVILQQMLNAWRAANLAAAEEERQEHQAKAVSKKSKPGKSKKQKGKSKNSSSTKPHGHLNHKPATNKLLTEQEDNVMREILLYLAKSEIKSWADDYIAAFKSQAHAKQQHAAATMKAAGGDQTGASAGVAEEVEVCGEGGLMEGNKEGVGQYGTSSEMEDAMATVSEVAGVPEVGGVPEVTGVPEGIVDVPVLPEPQLRRGLLREDEMAVLLFEAEELRKQRLRTSY